jgi:hypothetical protein
MVLGAAEANRWCQKCIQPPGQGPAEFIGQDSVGTQGHMPAVLFGGAKRHDHRVSSVFDFQFYVGPGQPIKMQCSHYGLINFVQTGCYFCRFGEKADHGRRQLKEGIGI